MNGTERLLASGLVPEKRAGVRERFEDAFVKKELDLVGVNGDLGFFPGVFVVYRKPVVPQILLYGVNIPKLAAAIAALETFEGQGPTSYRRLCQMARINSRAMRMIMTHSRKFECWIRTSSESME